MQKEVLINTKITSGVRSVLRNEGYTLVDMHFHTRYSDAVTSVPQALKKAKKLGIGLAITDHNEIQGAVLASQQKEVFIIPGMEITCKEGMHVLIYFSTIREYIQFFERWVKPFRTHHKNSFTIIPIEVLLKEAKKTNCVISMAHPYALGWTGIMSRRHKKVVTPKILSKFDAVEVLCGSSMKEWNKKSQLLGITLNKSITGGSDAHTLREMGHIVTYAKAKNAREFLDAIRKKQTCVIGRETNILYNVGSQMVKIKNVTSVEEMAKRKFNGFINTFNGKKKAEEKDEETDEEGEDEDES
jgi:predicted metal-dependent phosphoesterase TrpH